MSMSDDATGCLVSAQGNDVDGTNGSVGSNRGLDVAGLLRAAVDSQSKHLAVAASIGYQADYWARVLTGERGITLTRLGRLPRDVQIAFVEAWARALGLRFERRTLANQRRALRDLLEAARALTETV